MANQTEIIATESTEMLTLNATTIETSAAFTKPAKALVIATNNDVYISFDKTATTADPSILLQSGETLRIKDCFFRTIHAITLGTAIVRVIYQY